MEVKLIQKTQNIIDLIYTAMRTCYSAKHTSELWEDSQVTPIDKKLKLIKTVINSGHESPLEQVVFSFAVDSVSRSLLAQLSRHRFISQAVQSQRYVAYENGVEIYTPITIEKNEQALEIYNEIHDKINKAYKELLDLGIPAEDSRYVLSNATCTNITLKMNLRELIHICGLRLCTRASKEIRDLMKAIVVEVTRDEEWLKEYLQPKCHKLGFCTEHKCCGRKPHISEIVKKD